MIPLLLLLPALQDPRVEEARRLLADAGYPGGKDFPALKLLYNTAEMHRTVAAYVQHCWKQNLGVDIVLENADWKNYLDRLSKLEYQVARRGWIGDYADPQTFLETMTSGSSGAWGNRTFDELLAKASREPDAARRFEHLKRAENLLLEEMAVIPVYFYSSQNLWKPEVKGLHSNLLNIHPLNEVVLGDGAKTLVLQNHFEVASLDPALARGVVEQRVLIGLFEGLMNFHPETLKPVPGVAEKYTLSPDCQVYVFRLRECRWSDGRPVTAHDFEYAWKRVLDPATGSDYAHLLYAVKNGEKRHAGQAAADAVGVKAKDERTLVVELERPAPWFLETLALFPLYPVRKDLVERHGGGWTKPGNLAGNGPFVLNQWVQHGHILLDRNAAYWNAAKVVQGRIQWLVTEDIEDAFQQYEDGECHYLDTVPLEKVESLRKRADFHGAVFFGTYYFSLNTKQKPLDDRRVRRALALAIDRETLCGKILRGGQVPALHFVPPVLESRGYRSDPFVR